LELQHLLNELLRHVLFHLHFAGSRSPEKVKAARLVELWHWGCAPAGGKAGGDRSCNCDRGSNRRPTARRAQGCGCGCQQQQRRAAWRRLRKWGWCWLRRQWSPTTQTCCYRKQPGQSTIRLAFGQEEPSRENIR